MKSSGGSVSKLQVLAEAAAAVEDTSNPNINVKLAKPPAQSAPAVQTGGKVAVRALEVPFGIAVLLVIVLLADKVRRHWTGTLAKLSPVSDHVRTCVCAVRALERRMLARAQLYLRLRELHPARALLRDCNVERFHQFDAN